MFIDEAQVILRAGAGGNGCASFRREKFVPRGGPDGGDGGDGGSLILACDENVADLRAFHFQPHWSADNGRPGMGRGRHGRSGADCVLKVPPGLVVSDPASGTVLAELLKPGERLTLLAGGKGGIGNIHFKSSTNRAPRQFTAGEPGPSGTYRFVLKSIADIGLVGFPNAGKSSLIAALTASRPRTAPYPFTTLHANVGVLTLDDAGGRLKIADIPGLVEGAHENRGLGHRFLRHIERCAALLLVIDLAGSDGRDPVADYRHLLQELSCYDPAFLERPRLVAANKIDEAAARKQLPRFRRAVRDTIVPISCILGDGLPELREQLRGLLKNGLSSTPPIA
jgi:GTP-binding protein